MAGWKSTNRETTMGDLLQPWHLIVISFILLPISAVVLVPYWVIFKKAGFQPILSILMLVPFVNIVILYVVAFSKWKIVPSRES
jgi:NADH:ubiquinone oxidoreductase subunit 3 (subunit A)